MPKKINTTKLEKKYELNARQVLFCQLYVSKEFFANGVQSYIEAYDIDVTKKGAYRSARACASELLTKTNILKCLDSLLDEAGLNDSFVDKELLFLINQKADFASKLGAIKEYNKIRERIEDKIELTMVKVSDSEIDDILNKDVDRRIKQRRKGKKDKVASTK